jgi:hypothetical protein
MSIVFETGDQVVLQDEPVVVVGAPGGAIPGPPGPTRVSADANNAVSLGSDGLIYEKQLAYVVAKSSPPTAADYGLTTIPINAVWVQTVT